MERLDFCSITTIIKDYCNDEKLGAQVNYVEKLFRTCVYGDEDECVSFDDTQVCRWLKGQTNLTRPILVFYLTSLDHQQALKNDIEKEIVSILYDKEMAVLKLKELLLGDTTISDSQKENLLKRYGTGSDSQIAGFIADLLLFAMERKFQRRDADKKLLTTGEYSPVISDYIFENDPPSPCRYFCGRDAELEKLHEMLSEKGKICHDYAFLEETIAGVCLASGQFAKAVEHYVSALGVYKIIWEEQPELIENKILYYTDLLRPFRINPKPLLDVVQS